MIRINHSHLQEGDKLSWINDFPINQLTLDSDVCIYRNLCVCFLPSILEYNKLRSSWRSHYTQDITIVFKRKGGLDSSQSHNEWLQTVPQAPDVLSMKFVSITSLLNGVTGTGFLSHAINLYLRCMKLHFKVVLNICISSTAVYVCPKHRRMFLHR